MDGRYPELARRFDAGKLLGYLNFSDGRPDPKFRRQLADLFGHLRETADPAPWRTAGGWLAAAADELEAGGSAAFRDLSQGKAVRAAAFDHLPAAYRTHHADLLHHQPDAQLFTAFFLAKACEAVLHQRAKSPDAPPERLATAALGTLNDYVGYRPIAVLETRPQTDYYPHEKVCPVPFLLAGAGVAPGRYADLVRPALELLDKTDPAVREEACFDPAKMDELALDPRAADHFHPVNKRPNVLFGEWDPHRIDGRGYYRRFVLRQPTLDALLVWAHAGKKSPDPERLFEAAAVLAGTVLMGAGVSGAGPNHYDSSVTLSTLVQRIARYRDEFYRRLMEKLPGPHGERLRAEAAKLKQPFAGVRQFLNQSIAGERALHLQERRLALLFAAMGYPDAARQRAAHIPAPSVRFGCEIRLRQTAAEFAAKAGRASDAAHFLSEAEDLLRRGISCGAVIDPWNILGYQGLFPIFPGRDDTVRDPRAEELVLTLGRQFDRYAHALAASTTASDEALTADLGESMRHLAEWWDRFATPTVTDIPKVHGGERAEAAAHVARALALWRQAGTGADVNFWRQHRDGFRTPAAFAQVIEALLETGDFKGALALLVTWLGESGPDLPLQDPSASFVRLAFRWLKAAVVGPTVADRGPLVRRFFELLEANADDRWQVPAVTRAGADAGPLPEADDEDADDEPDEDEDDPFASAYEGMTYRDSADDGTEGAVADSGPAAIPGEFLLEAEAERFEERLRFLAAVARLWRTAARPDLWPATDPAASAAVAEWLKAARRNHARLKEFIDRLHAVEVPPPAAGVDGVTEYDRRRTTKGHLLDLAVQTAVETGAAARSLAAVLIRGSELASAEGGKKGVPDFLPAPARESIDPASDEPAWTAVAVRLERAIALGDAAVARRLLSAFVPLFRREPLLVHPPADGGPPAPALRAQSALQLLESLLARLPRLGLLRETYQLAKMARAMERNDPPEGRRVSSFDQLFRTAVVAVVDALVGTAGSSDEADDGPLAPALRQIAEAFHKLWLEHSQSLRLSALETVLDDSDWTELKEFVKDYGGDLFTVRFLGLSNVRGILAQGVTEWLERATDPENAPATGESVPKVIDAWADGELDKPRTVRHLETVLQALVEHYDEYRDYNTTTTQSDYGENLYILLDFLRLKVSYDRFAWRLRPLVLAHEVLCRRGHDPLAEKWRDFIRGKTHGLADDLLGKLAARETEHGMRLRTVRDRLEERFVHPLRIDQAAARVATAAATAKELAAAGQSSPESHPAFAALQVAIKPLAESPTGVGLDVPVWLRRLEDELRKFRTGPRPTDDDVTDAPDDPPPAPAPRLDFSDLKRQLGEWEKPID